MNATWVVQYNDGTQRAEKDGLGYRDIDRGRLSVFALCEEGTMRPLVVVHLSPERKLIYRKRCTVNERGERHHVYLVGWQELVGDGTFLRNVQTLTVLFDDGHVEVTDGFKEGHPWFGNVKFLPEEIV